MPYLNDKNVEVGKVVQGKEFLDGLQCLVESGTYGILKPQHSVEVLKAEEVSASDPLGDAIKGDPLIVMSLPARPVKPMPNCRDHFQLNRLRPSALFELMSPLTGQFEY